MRIATSRTCFPSLGVPFPRLSPKTGNRFAEIRSGKPSCRGKIWHLSTAATAPGLREPPFSD